jgi:hypothetical protein
MSGVIKVIRSRTQVSCWIRDDHDLYQWSLDQAITMLPEVDEVRGVWGVVTVNEDNTVCFDEYRTSRIGGVVRTWQRTH